MPLNWVAYLLAVATAPLMANSFLGSAKAVDSSLETAAVGSQIAGSGDSIARVHYALENLTVEPLEDYESLLRATQTEVSPKGPYYYYAGVDDGHLVVVGVHPSGESRLYKLAVGKHPSPPEAFAFTTRRSAWVPADDLNEAYMSQWRRPTVTERGAVFGTELLNIPEIQLEPLRFDLRSSDVVSKQPLDQPFELGEDTPSTDADQFRWATE